MDTMSPPSAPCHMRLEQASDITTEMSGREKKKEAWTNDAAAHVFQGLLMLFLFLSP